MHALKEHRAVKSDIAEAFHWYEDQRTGIGRAFTNAVKQAYTILRQNPTRNAVRFSDVRRYNLKRFPYAIFYFLEGEVIVVIGVLHVKRNARSLLDPRRGRS
jgi:toxin ParE1/3/4